MAIIIKKLPTDIVEDKTPGLATWEEATAVAKDLYASTAVNSNIDITIRHVDKNEDPTENKFKDGRLALYIEWTEMLVQNVNGRNMNVVVPFSVNAGVAYDLFSRIHGTWHKNVIPGELENTYRGDLERN